MNKMVLIFLPPAPMQLGHTWNIAQTALVTCTAVHRRIDSIAHQCNCFFTLSFAQCVDIIVPAACDYFTQRSAHAGAGAYGRLHAVPGRGPLRGLHHLLWRHVDSLEHVSLYALLT
jgi:hypothetical protein